FYNHSNDEMIFRSQGNDRLKFNPQGDTEVLENLTVDGDLTVNGIIEKDYGYFDFSQTDISAGNMCVPISDAEGTGITYNGGAGTFTLEANKRYLINVNMHFTDMNSSEYVNFQLAHSAGPQYEGSEGVAFSSTTSYTDNSIPSISYIAEATTDRVYCVYIKGDNADANVGSKAHMTIMEF
ncbi:MAG: hypothetical protein MI892_31615, partial [Desulfobacterales bacterium]|nr:hypothetical protein [Desulfobacterales bacterium]